MTRTIYKCAECGSQSLLISVLVNPNRLQIEDVVEMPKTAICRDCNKNVLMKEVEVEEIDLVEVTPDNFTGFKALYEQAVAEKKRYFDFKGQQVLTDYAKYLIQYLEKEWKDF